MAKKIMQTVSGWTPGQLDDQAGRSFLITGANSGIGFEAAKILRAANGDVLIGCRSKPKGEAAVADIEAVGGSGSVQLVEIDLADTDSIRQAVTDLHDRVDGLDAIVNNAGVMQTPPQKTADGFEMQFGTNHLGHFLMNHLAFDLVEARGGRIVAVSSIAHRQSRGIDFDDPMLEGGYSSTRAYSQSKLANLTYGLELARRLDAAGSDAASVSAHPGYAATSLQSTGPTGFLKAFYKFTNLFAQSAEQGSWPLVLAAAGGEARSGGYYGPSSVGETRGKVGDAAATNQATDPEAGRRLWELSEQLLEISWPI